MEVRVEDVNYNIMADDYSKFIEDLRKKLANHPHKEMIHDVPVLARQQSPRQPARWMYINLVGRKKDRATVAVRDDNVYLMGFRNMNGEWFHLGFSKWSVPILPESSKFLECDVAYRNLLDVPQGEQVMSRLVEVELRKTVVLDAVHRLSRYTQRGQDDRIDRFTKRDLARLIIVICESARMRPHYTTVNKGFVHDETTSLTKLHVFYLWNWGLMSRALRQGWRPWPIRLVEDARAVVQLLLNAAAAMPLRMTETEAASSSFANDMPFASSAFLDVMHFASSPDEMAFASLPFLDWMDFDYSNTKAKATEANEQPAAIDDMAPVNDEEPAVTTDDLAWEYHEESAASDDIDDLASEDHEESAASDDFAPVVDEEPAATDYEDEFTGQVHGRRLVELLAVSSDFDSFMISIFDGKRGQIVYNHHQGHHTVIHDSQVCITRGCYRNLVLTGPYRAISADGSFLIEVDTNNEDVHPDKKRKNNESEVSSDDVDGTLFWDSYNDYNYTRSDRILAHTIRTSLGPVEVTYAVLTNAVEATVQVKLLLLTGDGAATFAGSDTLFVYGDITVRSHCFDVASMLFSHGSQNKVAVALTSDTATIPLSRCVVAVPLHHRVEIEAKLYVETSNEEESINYTCFQGKLDFAAGRDQQIQQISHGDNPAVVEVTWSPDFF
ncbi:60 kDa jasmonate-induced protein [Oryza sativa Japonica Group]|uniref:60 kDa jasmonate-induced protein n=1 Tax=Oryza sativa subsp. japonica TaxID=39947 RepID=UPI00339C4598